MDLTDVIPPSWWNPPILASLFDSQRLSYFCGLASRLFGLSLPHEAASAALLLWSQQTLSDCYRLFIGERRWRGKAHKLFAVRGGLARVLAWVASERGSLVATMALGAP